MLQGLASTRTCAQTAAASRTRSSSSSGDEAAVMGVSDSVAGPAPQAATASPSTSRRRASWARAHAGHLARELRRRLVSCSGGAVRGERLGEEAAVGDQLRVAPVGLRVARRPAPLGDGPLLQHQRLQALLVGRRPAVEPSARPARPAGQDSSRPCPRWRIHARALAPRARSMRVWRSGRVPLSASRNSSWIAREPSSAISRSRVGRFAAIQSHQPGGQPGLRGGELTPAPSAGRRAAGAGPRASPRGRCRAPCRGRRRRAPARSEYQ